MIYWAPLLHFYQPPTQLFAMLEKIANESYRPLVSLFREYPQARATVNINAGLTEMLKQRCFADVVDGLGELAARGQIEFTGSGKYHPILPLIPRSEVRRQIVLNRRTNDAFFGPVYQPRGFFPPEMAYSKDIVDPIIEAGDKWIILSGVACPVEWPMDVIHKVASPQGELSVFFRDDVLSNKISFQTITGPEFLSHLKGLGAGTPEKNVYVVTAMDAETFGHHIQHWERLFLAEVYEALELPEEAYEMPRQPAVIAEQHRSLLDMSKSTGNVQVVTISELLSIFPEGRTIEPKRSSWSTTADDIKAGNYYPLWASPGNVVHKLLWEHMNIAIALTHRAFELAGGDDGRRFADVARGLLDRALHSDQFWWASQRPMWDINLIHKGLIEQEEVVLNAYKSIYSSKASQEEKRERYYQVIVASELRGKLRDYLFFGGTVYP